MNKLLVLIGVFIIMVGDVKAQSYKSEGKYFKYTIHQSTRAASPLFARSYDEKVGMVQAEVQPGYRDWTGFTTEFIDRVLKKYLTIEEIRKMLKENNKIVSAHLVLYFDYYGNIGYVIFIYGNELENILTDEKLYHIYQGLAKLKIDTTGFEWWVNQERPTVEQQKHIFGVTSIPFFFQRNCP